MTDMTTRKYKHNDPPLSEMLPSLEDYLQNISVYGMYDYLNAKNRVLYLQSEIETESVDYIIQAIRYANREDYGKPVEERRPIIFHISSNGGNVDDGFTLIDTMLESKTPIWTVNDSYVYSMATCIFITGHKRFCTEHSQLLIHDGCVGAVDSGSKFQDHAKFLAQTEQSLRDYIISRTKISKRMYSNKHRSEWYMNAGDQKKYGCADYIIGEDCDIEDLIR